MPLAKSDFFETRFCWKETKTCNYIFSFIIFIVIKRLWKTANLLSFSHGHSSHSCHRQLCNKHEVDLLSTVQNNDTGGTHRPAPYAWVRGRRSRRRQWPNPLWRWWPSSSFRWGSSGRHLAAPACLCSPRHFRHLQDSPNYWALTELECAFETISLTEPTRGTRASKWTHICFDEFMFITSWQVAILSPQLLLRPLARPEIE